MKIAVVDDASVYLGSIPYRDSICCRMPGDVYI